MDHDAFLRVRDHRNGYLRQVDIFIRHPAKGFGRHGCQLRQRFIAVDDRFHQVGGVVFIAKRVQGIQHRAVRFVAQGFQVTTGEARTRVRRVDGFGADLRHAHTVSRAGHGQLGIHRIAFTIGVFFIQQRRGDGIGKAIDSPFQRIIFDFEIKGRAVRCRTGIVAAAMHLQKFGQAIWLRVFF